MTVSDESVYEWIVERYGINSIVRQGNIVELRTSSRHFFVNFHGDTVTISRHCWDNKKIRFFQVPYETTDFFSALEKELVSPLPDWPEEPLIRAICQRFRELYGHAAVTIDNLAENWWDPRWESLILTRAGRCYEAYIEADYLVLAAETWSQDDHISKLLVADPNLWDKIGPELERLSLDPVGDYGGGKPPVLAESAMSEEVRPSDDDAARARRRGSKSPSGPSPAMPRGNGVGRRR